MEKSLKKLEVGSGQSISLFYEYCPALFGLSIFGFPLHTIRNVALRVGLILIRLVLLMALILMTMWATYVVYMLLRGTKKGIGFNVFVVCYLYHALVAFYTVWTTKHTFVLFLDGVTRHWKRFLTNAQKLNAGRRLRCSSLKHFSVSMSIIVAAIVISCFDINRRTSTAEFLATYNSSLAAAVNATMYSRLQRDGLRAPMPYFMVVELFNLLVILLEIHVCKLLQVCFELTTGDRSNDLIDSGTSLTSRHYFNMMIQFKQCHESTCKLIKVADRMFSTVIFTWAGGVLISSCCIVYSVKNTPFELYHVAIVALLLLHVFYFIVLVFQAAAVNDKVTQIADHLRGCLDIVEKHEFDDDFRVGIKFTALYMARMSIVPQGMTTIGVFVVRRDLVLTVFGTALTYSIIVYDLN